MKNIFVTGGAGYVGSSLIPRLLNQGYKVTAYDLMIYGVNVLPNHENLKIIKGDIRNTNLLNKEIPGHDIVIHLACISNDPSFELNPKLGKEINFDAFKPLVEISKRSGINKFIYASSSSVYGIKEDKNVHENVLLEPLTDYSLYKMQCEEILNEHQTNDFIVVTLRPATVCGYAPRQRLDVVVNILTNLAYHKRSISVFGGDQLRPNIHIKDMTEDLTLIDAPNNKIQGEIFNVGYENHSVMDIAKIVKSVIGDDVELIVTPTDDNRSYHISSKRFIKYLILKLKTQLKASQDLKKYSIIKVLALNL